MTPDEAIAVLNNNRFLLPASTTATLARVICRAAVLHDDIKAAHFLWLLQWQPQQLAN